MLVMNPRRVTFGTRVWEDVTTIAIDRKTTRPVTEWSDLGPHTVLADAPEQSVTIRVVSHIARDDLDAPAPGDEAELVFATSPSGADTPRRRVRATCVVLETSHEISLKHGAVRTVKLVALSTDGATDPITTEDAEGTE